MSTLTKYWNRCVRLFDRSFSSGWGRQVMFLGGALLVSLFLGTLALYCTADLSLEEKDSRSFIRTLELLLDPGSFNGSTEDFPIIVQLFITLVGAVFFYSNADYCSRQYHQQ